MEGPLPERAFVVSSYAMHVLLDARRGGRDRPPCRKTGGETRTGASPEPDGDGTLDGRAARGRCPYLNRHHSRTTLAVIPRSDPSARSLDSLAGVHETCANREV